ncbi:MAG: T9SS type A sorting domain-containing protein [Saprospiraceae bacterium]
MKNIYVLFFLMFSIYGNAQTVSTFYSSAGVDDGLAFDSEGNLYGARYNGSKVEKITPDGVKTTFVSGLDTPNGLAFDSQGNLHVIDNQGGKILRVSPDMSVDTYVPNIFSPSGIIKMPDSDTMIVSSWEGDKLIKVAPDGSYEDFVVGEGLEGPVGLAYDENNTLYVGNYNDRWIFSISPSGNLDTLTKLNVSGNNIGFIAYRDGFIYATIPWDNKVYKVDLDGNYELFAGTSAGNIDGDVPNARLNGPNGIILSPGGDSLYISDYNTASVRIISNLEGTVGTDDFIRKSTILKSKLIPNPANEKTELSFDLIGSEEVNISIFDIEGREVKTILNNKLLPTGNHKLTIDVNELEHGSYFVQIKTKRGDEVVRKLVKVK